MSYSYILYIADIKASGTSPTVLSYSYTSLTSRPQALAQQKSYSYSYTSLTSRPQALLYFTDIKASGTGPTDRTD